MFYVILGALGLPFYADGAGGWEVATGSTAGYLVGFIVAAFLVGLMAERGQDRNLVTSLPAFIAGSIIIYTFGALWLAYNLDIPLTAGATEASAVAYGVTPFIVGDILKAALAGVLLPGVWRLRWRDWLTSADMPATADGLWGPRLLMLMAKAMIRAKA